MTDTLSRYASGDDASLAPDARERLTAAAGSTGSALPAGLRGRPESSLGADLSGVRVHTGSESAAAASAVGATAYTIGQDVHFGAGHYDPASVAGQSLIAHEVAHTVQQRNASVDVRQHKLEVSSPGDQHELEAEAFAQAFIAGDQSRITPVSQGSVSRVVISRQPGAGGAAPAAFTPDVAPIVVSGPAPMIGESVTAHLDVRNSA